MKMFGSLRAFHISCEEKAEIPEGVCGGLEFCRQAGLSILEFPELIRNLV